MQAVVFDVGGVLADQDIEAADAGYGALRPDLTAGIVNAARRAPELYDLWERYSVGRLASETYWTAVALALGLPAKRWGALRRVHADTVWARPLATGWMAARSLRRRSGLSLGILSNSAPECESHTSPMAGLFDVLHFSHRTGRRKPEAEAYLAMALALGAEPRRIVFVDDQQRNLEAASAVGMIALCGEPGSAMIEGLREVGLPIEDRDGPRL